MKNNYPSWVCVDCGNKARDEMNKGGVKHCGRAMMSTWHNGKCDVCGETKEVTEPRDFGYPEFVGVKDAD